MKKKPMFVMVAVLALTGLAGAGVVLNHQGSNDPATEGFNYVTNSPQGGISASIGPVTGDLGNDAWQINTMAKDNLYAYYQNSSFASQWNDLYTNGWKLTVKARVVQTYLAGSANGGASLTLKIAGLRYNLGLNVDQANTLTPSNTQVWTNSGTVHNLPGGSIYHTFVLYCPGHGVTDNATLYVDGVLVESNIERLIDSGTDFYFGDTSGNSSQVTDTNWSQVKLETPAGSPPTPPAATPTFNPSSGSYSGPVSVTISSVTPGATIYYTTDNTTPTTSSPNSGASPLTITVTPTMTVQAIAAAAGLDNSALGSSTYSVYTPTVVMNHDGSNDPTMEGFNYYTNSPQGGISAFIGPVTGDLGKNAWEINTMAKDNLYAFYQNTGFASQWNDLYTNGWKLTVKARVVQTYLAGNANAGASLSLFIAGLRYNLGLNLDSTGTPTNTQVWTNSGTVHNLPGGSIYHTFVLMCPGHGVTDNATLYVDGVLIESNIQFLSGSGTLLYFGDVSGNSSQVTDTNWSMVKLETPAGSPPQPPVATPTFSPSSGSYSSSLSVTISSTTPGATIYYTTDGSTPTTSSPNSGASPVTITVTPTMTVQAIATAAGLENSAVGSATYSLYTPTVVLAHEGANDPETEGFYYTANSYNYISPTVSPVSDSGVDAWQINTMAQGQLYAFYENDSTMAAEAMNLYTNGWKLTVKARVVQTYLAGNINAGAALTMKIGGLRYNLGLNLDNTSNPQNTQVWTDNETIHNLPGGSTYHTYVLYCPAESVNPNYYASLYVDGQLVKENIKSIDSGSTLYFGDLSGSSSQVTNTNWAQVKLETPAGSPPPPQAATPTMNPGSGSYSSPQSVTISCTTSGATIYYTTDGTPPTTSSPNSGASPLTVSVSQSLTLKAMTVAPGMDPSAVASATYAFVYTGGNIPHTAITLDGNASDWPTASQWSPPFVFWYGAGLTSTTKAKFAWNVAQNVLYATVQTDEASVRGGGHLVMGFTDNVSSVPEQSLDSTQLCFEYNTAYPGNVFIDNEIAHYLPLGPGVTTGVQASCDNASGTYTYEISLPLWRNWTYGTNRIPLTNGKVIYLYAVMQSQYSGTAPGTDLSYYGNPQFGKGGSLNPSAWTYAAALTLSAPTSADLTTVLTAMDSASGGPNWNSQADIDGDSAVTSTDLAIILANMQ